MTDASKMMMELQKDVQYLMDRTAILDCIARHSRGQDRHDVEMLTSAYHKDARDEHGVIVNKASDYAKWVNALHDSLFCLHTHNICTHNCEIEGDTAHCESYVLFGLLTKEMETVWFGGGRYLDRLEKRNGEWKIALRRTMIDYIFEADAAVFNSKVYQDMGYPMGRNNMDDLSYLRPLRLDNE